MPRRRQVSSGGTVFHVMNRAARRALIFTSPSDYEAFERILSEAGRLVAVRLLAYTVMPNHWHLIVWPVGDGDLSRYMQWLTRTHAQRWHLAHGSVGNGAVYQGRFRAVAVQTDDHFLTVCRYVERNPLRAGLVGRASDWPWSSAWVGARATKPELTAWPVSRPRGWAELLNGPEPGAQLGALRRCIRHGVPYGSRDWTTSVASFLAGRLRGRGRPPRAAT
jgi:putative transposase